MGSRAVFGAVLAVVLIIAKRCSGVSETIACGSDIETHVCLQKNYSNMDIPLVNTPNVIWIELHISDILKICDSDFSITFSLYFNVMWKDARINLTPKFFQNRTAQTSDLSPVDLNLINDLWVPNVFIYNLKTFKVIDVLSKLAGLWVSAEKDIMYSQASQITFICPMIFNYFPLDTQVCKFQVGSYSYNMEKMIFEVSQLGYAHTSRSIVLDYDVQIQPLPEDDRVFLGGPLGNFSLAGFEMTLKRHVSHYIINFYLPSGLFVVVSWISFLVPADIIPGRMALLVTLFLVLVNIFNTVTTNTPKAEGLTAIEAWMLACILFVFGALTEYACLLFIRGLYESRDEDADEQKDPSCSRCVGRTQAFQMEASPSGLEGDQMAIEAPVDEAGAGELASFLSQKKAKQTLQQHTSLHSQSREKRLRKTFAKADRFFLVFFPFMFISFNAIYWYIYYFEVAFR